MGDVGTDGGCGYGQGMRTWDVGRVRTQWGFVVQDTRRAKIEEKKFFSGQKKLA